MEPHGAERKVQGQKNGSLRSSIGCNGENMQDIMPMHRATVQTQTSDAYGHLSWAFACIHSSNTQNSRCMMFSQDCLVALPVIEECEGEIMSILEVYLFFMWLPPWCFIIVWVFSPLTLSMHIRCVNHALIFAILRNLLMIFSTHISLRKSWHGRAFYSSAHNPLLKHKAAFAFWTFQTPIKQALSFLRLTFSLPDLVTPLPLLAEPFS